MNKLLPALAGASILFFASCEHQEIRQPLEKEEKNTALDLSIERARSTYADERKYIDSLVRQTVEYPLSDSPDGFRYLVFGYPDHSVKAPVAGDTVQLEYTILDIEGEQYYHWRKDGIKEFIVEKANEIKGLQQAVKLMQVNQRAIFVFPSYLAYGFYGDGDKIKSNRPLVYRVRLISVNGRGIVREDESARRESQSVSHIH